MAEEAVEIPQSAEGSSPPEATPPQDMELEPVAGSPRGSDGVENSGAKRAREGEEEEEKDEDAKKQKLERSLEEERLEKLEEKKGEEEEDEGPKRLGPKEFGSSVEMFEYFMKLLHNWSPNLDVNKYEHMVLLDLLKKGHLEPDKKIGVGIQAFQVRIHPAWKSRCFFLVRIDGTSDDFSFRKCVDRILPLPDNMKAPSAADANKHHKGGGHGNQGGRGGGRGSRGRGRGKRGGK